MDRLVTLLPPQVPHNGRAATSAGFGKRVVYLDLSALPASLIGHAVDQPVLSDALLRQRISQLHRAVDQPGEEFEAESRLAFIAERLRWHLGKRHGPDAPMAGASVADELRGLIDSRFRESMTLREAADALHAHPAHLVRAFSRAFGMSPHQYLTSRRIDLARRLLLDGMPPARAAAEAGFYDQPHLNRHFRHILGTSPGRYARSRLTVRGCSAAVLVVGIVDGIPAGRNDTSSAAPHGSGPGAPGGRYLPVDGAAATRARRPRREHKQPQHHAKGSDEHQDVADCVHTEAVRGYGRDPESKDRPHRDQDRPAPIVMAYLLA